MAIPRKSSYYTPMRPLAKAQQLPVQFVAMKTLRCRCHRADDDGERVCRARSATSVRRCTARSRYCWAGQRSTSPRRRDRRPSFAPSDDPV